MDLKGKVALITGGAQGIGKAYCSALLRSEMKVCICDINEYSTQEYLSQLPEDQKQNVFFQKCDVTSFNELKDAFDKGIAKFGRINLVINNAGIFNEHEWRKVVEVNFIGVIHGIKLAFQYMDTSKGGFGGFVVNTASNASFEPFELGPVYAGCKHGVVGLTKSYGTDFHYMRTGIKVCAVCPGPVDTPLFHRFPDNSLDVVEASYHNATVKPIPPECVADALIKILKDGINGSLLRVDDSGFQYLLPALEDIDYMTKS